jgi:hypothetical protein
VVRNRAGKLGLCELGGIKSLCRGHLRADPCACGCSFTAANALQFVRASDGDTPKGALVLPAELCRARAADASGCRAPFPERWPVWGRQSSAGQCPACRLPSGAGRRNHCRRKQYCSGFATRCVSSATVSHKTKTSPQWCVDERRPTDRKATSQAISRTCVVRLPSVAARHLEDHQGRNQPRTSVPSPTLCRSRAATRGRGTAEPRADSASAVLVRLSASCLQVPGILCSPWRFRLLIGCGWRFEEARCEDLNDLRSGAIEYRRVL